MAEPEPGDGRAEARKDDGAPARTELARERTMLARERTFSAWLRTGLAATASGIGLAWLPVEGDPLAWPRRAAGALIALAGAAVLFFSLRAHSKEMSAGGHTWGVPVPLLWLFAAMVLAGALLALAAVAIPFLP